MTAKNRAASFRKGNAQDLAGGGLKTKSATQFEFGFKLVRGDWAGESGLVMAAMGAVRALEAQGSRIGGGVGAVVWVQGGGGVGAVK